MLIQQHLTDWIITSGMNLMMNKKILALTCCVALASLSGCATSKQIQGPNGSKTYYIKCGSAVLDACYEEAAKVCPKGYTMADHQAGSNAAIIPTGNMLIVAHGPNSMLVECKE